MSQISNNANNATTRSSKVIKAFEDSSEEVPSLLEPLSSDMIFLKHAINLLIGESKSGKTFTAIKSLIDAGLKEQIIHLDFDRNADESLKELGVKTYNIPNSTKLISSLQEIKYDGELKGSLDNIILVIDSLQDLSSARGLDSNEGAKETMERVSLFQEMGSTIILIHHVTKTENTPFSIGYKIKGNASTISSKCDCCIGLDKRDTTRTMSVLWTRAEKKIPSGSKITYENEVRQKEKHALPK